MVAFAKAPLPAHRQSRSLFHAERFSRSNYFSAGRGTLTSRTNACQNRRLSYDSCLSPSLAQGDEQTDDPVYSMAAPHNKNRQKKNWDKHTKKRPGSREKKDINQGRRRRRMYDQDFTIQPNDLGTITRITLVVTGVGVIGGTIVEDFFTGGAGLVDDPVTISFGAGMISLGLGLNSDQEVLLEDEFPPGG